MKKNYEQPLAEKIVFNYAENVVAESNTTTYGGGCGTIYNPPANNSTAPAGSGLRQGNGGEWWYNDQKVNNDPYGGWACKSTDHHDCYQF